MGWVDKVRYSSSNCARLVAVMVMVTPGICRLCSRAVRLCWRQIRVERLATVVTACKNPPMLTHHLDRKAAGYSISESAREGSDWGRRRVMVEVPAAWGRMIGAQSLCAKGCIFSVQRRLQMLHHVGRHWRAGFLRIMGGFAALAICNRQ